MPALRDGGPAGAGWEPPGLLQQTGQCQSQHTVNHQPRPAARSFTWQELGTPGYTSFPNTRAFPCARAGAVQSPGCKAGLGVTGQLKPWKILAWASWEPAKCFYGLGNSDPQPLPMCGMRFRSQHKFRKKCPMHVNKSLCEGKHCLQREPRPWAAAPSLCPGEHEGRPFLSCPRISSDTSLGALSGWPSTPWCTGTLPILCTPCLAPWASWPACLETEPAVWQKQLCCSPGSSASPRHQPGPLQTPPVPGDTRGAGAGGQGAWAAGHRGLGTAGQTKGSQAPRGRLGSEPVPEC